MFMQLYCSRRLPAALPFVLLTLSGMAIPLQAQARGAASPEVNARVPAYEIVSIKLTSPDERNSGWKGQPNGFDYNNMPLAWLVYRAYGITVDSQISGLPEWVKTDHYSVSARVDEDTAAAWKRLSSKDLANQQQPMLQAMFAERFQMKMRRVVKELPVYDLVVAKGGLKMKEAAPDEKESSV